MHKSNIKRNLSAMALALGAAAIAPVAHAETLGFVPVGGVVEGSPSASKVWNALSGKALTFCKSRYSRTTYVKLYSYKGGYTTQEFTGDGRRAVEASFACRR
jgi:hypothetical protein